MSRSVKSRKEKHGAFISYVCYFSNKKDKRLANQRFRTTERNQLRKMVSDDELDRDPVKNIREVSDVWNFDSDGLAHYISFLDKGYDGEEWTRDEIRKYRMK